MFELMIAFLAGALLAFALTFFLMKRQAARRPDDAARELARYRQEVATHFRNTATAVDRMTDSYKEVFDNLRSGAHALLDEATLKQQLADERSEVITINRLGSTATDSEQVNDGRTAPPDGGPAPKHT